MQIAIRTRCLFLFGSRKIYSSPHEDFFIRGPVNSFIPEKTARSPLAARLAPIPAPELWKPGRAGAGHVAQGPPTMHGWGATRVQLHLTLQRERSERVRLNGKSNGNAKFKSNDLSAVYQLVGSARDPALSDFDGDWLC